MSTAMVDIPQPLTPGRGRSAAQRLRVLASGAAAGLLGLLPHVLHHAGPLAGAALFAGATGSLLFAAIGFVVAVPFLLRVRRRCGNWRVPAGILAAMAVTFSLSTFVIGPAITGGGDDDSASAPSQSVDGPDAPAGHEAHH